MTNPSERFWSHTDTSEGPLACWPWMLTKGRGGYGQIKVGRKTTPTHRFSWEINVGPIPPGLCVLHHCDNPPCVNPAHLFLGTNTENMADRDAKKRQARGDRNGARTQPERHARGEASGLAKITAGDVMSIRAIYAYGGISQQALGDRYGLSQGQVGKIIHRERWQHVA